MRRWEWLAVHANRNNWKFGAEIGVKEGQTTCYLLGHCPQLNMIAVDCWEPRPESGEQFGYLDWPHDDHEMNFRMKAMKFGKRVGIVKGDSVDAADFIADGSLDFVFIDGDHSYEGVKADIEAWKPKVRGMLAGHDVNWPSVRKALDETLPDYQEAGHDRCWFCLTLTA